MNNQFYGDARLFEREKLIKDIEKLISSESAPELVEAIQLLERSLELIKQIK